MGTQTATGTQGQPDPQAQSQRPPDWPACKDYADSLRFLSSRCKIYGRWVNNYKERTNIRINLLFHLANQQEARTNIEIAQSSKDIAERSQREAETSTKIAEASAQIARQTQHDSASMITIAVVTLLFLPGTCISAIVSTNIFDYGDAKLSTSKQTWVLAASIPAFTLLVLRLWWFWYRIGMFKNQYQLDHNNEDPEVRDYLEPWLRMGSRKDAKSLL